MKNQILRNGLLCCLSLLAAHSLVIQSVGNAAEPAPIRFLKTWGQQGDQPGEFGGKATPNSRVGGPQFLAFDSEGNLWTTEGANCRVQQFSSAGKYLRGCGEKQRTAAGEFYAPHGMAFDSQGDLYVVDAYNHRIQKFAVAP